jgi:ferredoxin
VTQSQAVEVLQAAAERGDVHTGYFKKEMAGRLFAICNCCDCCCVGVRMWNMVEGALPILASSGYVSSVGTTCDGCGACAADGACPFRALGLDEAGTRAVVRRDKCMGCGVCERLCPQGALKLVREPSKGDPLDVDAILRAVADPVRT